MGKRIIPQHEPLRVPKGWTEQARAFVIQLERIIDRIYAYVSGGFSKHDEEIATLDASQLTKQQNLTEEQKAAVRANVDLNVANNLTTEAAGSVLDARQGKILGDRQIISVNANSASSLNAAIEMFHAAQEDMRNVYGRFSYNGVVYAVTGFKHSSNYGTYLVSSYAGGISNAWQAAKYNGTWSVEKLTSYKQNAWTPKLYDYETYLRDLPTWYYHQIGDLVIAPFRWQITEPVTFSTMIQIRNLPCRTVLGGTIYIAQLDGNGADMTFQGNVSNGYVRPNFKGTLSGGWFTGMIIGYNW